MQEQLDTAVNRPSSPASHAHDHLDSFEEFFGQFNQAANSSIPKLPRTYSDVFVLLLRWEDDDLGTESELDDLEDIFRNIYHYNTERYLIPSNVPSKELEYRLISFRLAHDNKDGTNLLIMYYGGHGSVRYSTAGGSESIWRANLNNGATLVWSDLQGVLERAESDVVFILDCCFAASASRGAGSKEGLWARNSTVYTTGVNDNSVTRNLIEELRSLSTT